MKKFIIKDGEEADTISYDIPSHYNLEQVLEALTLFLKSSGFQLNGFLDVVHYDDLK
jgi:hypothetical protein